MAKGCTFIQTHQWATCKRSWLSQIVLQTALPHDLRCQTPRRQKQRNCSKNYIGGERVFTDSLHINLTQWESTVMRQTNVIDYLWQKKRGKLKTHYRRQLLYINLKLIAREKLFSPKHDLCNNRNKKIIKFYVNLTRHRSDLLEKAHNHIQNLHGIKFCFSDANDNLSINFNDNKNLNLSLWGTHWEKTGYWRTK